MKLKFNLAVIKFMRMFGFCPLYTKSDKKNYIFPIMISIFHMIGIFCIIKCNVNMSSFKRTLYYADIILQETLFIAVFLATTTKINSWQVLFQVTDSYPKNDKTVLQKIIFVTISFSHLYIIGYELLLDHVSIECTTSWVFKHISHYLANMVTYFITEFVLILDMFYSNINKTLINVCKKKFRVKNVDFPKKCLNKYLIKEIRIKHLKYYYLLHHFNNIFGWPLYFVFANAVVTILKSLNSYIHVYVNVPVFSQMKNLNEILLVTVSIFNDFRSNSQ